MILYFGPVGLDGHQVAKYSHASGAQSVQHCQDTPTADLKPCELRGILLVEPRKLGQCYPHALNVKQKGA